MAMENYVPVMFRVKQFRSDNTTKDVLIETEPTLNFEKECVMFKAAIKVDGKVVAVGHSLAPSLGDDKEFEKAETVAVGRALAFLGYEADDSGESDEKSSKKSEKKSGKGGLGGLGGSKKSKPKDDDEEDSEEESEGESDEEEEKPAKKSVSTKKSSKPEEEEESDEEEPGEESEDEEEGKLEKKAASPNVGKLGGVMAKYGLKKKE